MAQNNNGTIPLHTAALKGFTDIVVLLAGQNNCNPMGCDHRGRTALHCACQEGYLAIVQFLVEEKGCNPNVKEFDNNLSPLHYAIMNGQTHVVKYLCGLQNVDTESVDSQGRNCVFKACQNGYFDIVQFLVEKCNGNYTRADNEGIVPFHVAAYMKAMWLFWSTSHSVPA